MQNAPKTTGRVHALAFGAVVVIAVGAVGLVHAIAGGEKPTPGIDAGQRALIDRVTALEAKVAALNTHAEIHQVYLNYMRGFDRNDAELLKTAFWPDAQINYPSQKRPDSVDDFFTKHMDGHIKLSTHWGHLLTNEFVEIDGDIAHVETYVTEFSSFKNGKSRIVSGRYVDRLDRRNGEWRIAIREFVPHFFTETDVALGFDFKWPATKCREGTWDKRDVSYIRPLTARTDQNSGPLCKQ